MLGVHMFVFELRSHKTICNNPPTRTFCRCKSNTGCNCAWGTYYSITIHLAKEMFNISEVYAGLNVSVHILEKNASYTTFMKQNKRNFYGKWNGLDCLKGHGQEFNDLLNYSKFYQLKNSAECKITYAVHCKRIFWIPLCCMQ